MMDLQKMKKVQDELQ